MEQKELLNLLRKDWRDIDKKVNARYNVSHAIYRMRFDFVEVNYDSKISIPNGYKSCAVR